MYRVLASFRKTRLFILVFALKFEVGTKNYENSSEIGKATLFLFSAWVITLEKS